jgi:predicted phage-related endonuclease
MSERYDLNSWFESYKDTFASFAKAQQYGLRALERFARFHYAVAGDVLDAGLAHTRAALGARAAVGTEVIAELLQKQAELDTQLSERLKARAQEFSSLTAEAQQSAGSFAADVASRATAGAKKAA